MRMHVPRSIGARAGSVLSGGGSVPAKNAPPEAWVEMVNGMQRAAMSTRLGIPIIYGIDAVHGHGNVYKATIFPHNVGLGCTREPELARRIGAAVALEVRATGIPYVFAPCVAVCRDPRWGRCYESFSEDPEVVRDMTAIISGFQGEIPDATDAGRPYVAPGHRNVAACSKHYVGDGGTTKGVNEGNTVASFHDLMAVHMPPYYNAVIRGVSTVMVSFSSWNGVKMHANHFLVTDHLKNRLRFRARSRLDSIVRVLQAISNEWMLFQGFIISDWQGLDRITTPDHADYLLSIKLGILAGIDMVMIPYTYTEFIDDLTLLVRNGTIPMSRIDDAVRRILRAGGGVAAGHGGAGRQRRAVRRLRLHREAVQDVVPVGGPAAHERRRCALRGCTVPVWLWNRDTAGHILEGYCMAQN